MAMTTEKHKMGRPLVDPAKKRGVVMTFRVTEAECAAIETAAKAAGKPVSALLIEALRAVLSGGRSWQRCSEPGCKRRAETRGLCSTHYQRAKKREYRAHKTEMPEGQTNIDSLRDKG